MPSDPLRLADCPLCGGHVQYGLVSARLTVYKELYDDMLRKMMEVAEHGTAMDN